MPGTGDDSPALNPQLFKFPSTVETLKQDKDIIYLCEAGSRLYGTDHPGSDIDIKGVFIPHPRLVLLGHIPRTRHIKEEDLDVELFSLHHFMKLLSEGQTVAMEMVYARGGRTLKVHWSHWSHISHEAPNFLHKNLSAFVGYAKAQADKYVLRAERHTAVKSALDAVEGALDLLTFGHQQKYPDPTDQVLSKPDWRVEEIWGDLPEGEHLKKKGDDYLVCTKILQKSTPLEHAVSYLRRWEDAYGQRVREVDTETGIDWKSLSHAVRVAYELRELLIHEEIIFPLGNAGFLKDVKDGRVPFDTVGSMLKNLLAECEDLIEKSDLPDRAPAKLAEEIILAIMEPMTEEYLT
jgi:hypothetical protein